ncbi:MAG: kinase-like domain-containing protein [Benjaminiella poitrasii]|nr:MAG: kinase-like domain-containing protein [Benjaminiella poitrasii]
MDPFQQQQKETINNKKSSPSLLNLEIQQQKHRSLSTSLSAPTTHLSYASLPPPPQQQQDTNYIGITINEENTTRHQLLKENILSINTDSATLATATSIFNSPSSILQSSPRISNKEEEETYMIKKEMSGAFRKINSQADLPLSHHRRLREGKRYGPLYMLTIELKTTYQACNQSFRYNETNKPRRVLTKPSKAYRNDGYDNEDFDYILYVNDILGNTEGHKYLIMDVLGSGTFGQVVKCRNIKTQEIVAVKVVKNKLAYFKQSMMEVAILEMLNQRYDVHDEHHLLRLRDTFIHKKHLCLVFELLSVNLYELIKQNHFRGLSTNLVRVFTAQILDALTVLNEARIIHCDLKPENILLKNLESPTIKVIDFGSACHEVQTMYTYIQSRFYRSPEVLVGLPYTSAIDMWSLGCIAAELFLGLPLFPGSSEYNQLSRIVEMLGTPPNYMIEVGKNAHRYFDRVSIGDNNEKRYKLKSIEKYSQEQGKSEQPSKRYFSAKTLPDLINHYPMMRKAQMSTKEIEKEKQSRLAFIDFLQGLLNLNPIERWSPQQAKRHPFITGEKFVNPFQPPFIPRKQQQQQQQQKQQNNYHSQSPQSPSSSSQHYQPQLHSPTIVTNGYRNNNNNNNIKSSLPTASTATSSFLSPSYFSLPSHYDNNNSKRLSYIPPLPSVLEPPDHYQNDNNVVNGNRPRASTLGTMQVPPQIQWATVDQSAPEGSLYSPYYPYGQHQHQQQQQQQQQTPYYIANDDLLPRWNNNNRQTIDLERDGDWQENNLKSSTVLYQSPRQVPTTHRRSNSSVRFSDIASNSSVVGTRPSVASLHRLMRGHSISYHRQDIESDGVIQQPSITAPNINSTATTTTITNDKIDESEQNKGWMIA